MPAVPNDYQEGDALTVQDVNGVLACLRDLYNKIAVMHTELRFVKTPVAGIAAGGTADCKVCSINPSTGAVIEGTATLKVRHLPGATNAVAGSTYIVVGKVPGAWLPIVEPC